MPASVGAPLVEGVLLVDHYERPPGLHFHATSLPGHLIQLMDRGVARLQISGREYTLIPGDVIWYHEDETVTGDVIEGPWSFYTLNVVARALPPPPFERRVRRAGTGVAASFSRLLEAWRDDGVDPGIRELRVHRRLLALLDDLLGDGHESVPYSTRPLARVWWELETLVRQDLSTPLTMPAMAALVDRSTATIARACHEAVGLPPAKRIKQVRLSLARGLVWRSELGFGEIARQVGYPRVHEFSRDYRKHFAVTPTADRKIHGAARRPEPAESARDRPDES